MGVFNRFAVVAVAAVLASPAAAADFFLDIGPGTSSVDFGNTATTSGTLADRYFFTVPAGMVNGFVGSTALNNTLDIDFTSVLLDDKAFDVGTTGVVEFRSLDWTNLTAGQHVISVNGSWGPEGGSYAGTLNFSPMGGAVPEPATWAMMIGGMGMIGGAMRRRKVSTKVSFA